MQFGYFTLSDNHYENNKRNANTFVADIIDEAVYAEEVGLHSRLGSASITSAPWVCCLAPICCSPMSPRARGIFGWRRPSPFCPCITRSPSPSNGRLSTS